MSAYIPPAEQTDRLFRAVLGSISADHYANENDPHADAQAEHMTEQVARAARDLTRAVDALDPDRRPIGWAKDAESKPAEPAKPVNLAKLLDLIEALTDSGECRFDHHGGCKCPHAEAKELLADRPATIAAEPPRTWTGPDGTVYDLGHGLRDADGDVWVCVGWLQPFDGEPVPLMDCAVVGRTDLPDVIATYGPLTPRTDD